MKLLIIFIFLLDLASGSIRSWEKINEEKGISVYRTEISDSPLVGFKGDTIMDAPAEKVFGVLIDDKHMKEWVKDLKVSKILESFGPFEAILYEEYSLPWPLKNRDFVFHAGVFRDDEGRIHLTVKSVDHPLAPPTVGVRGEVLEGEYIITPLGKFKCKLEVEIISDPKGAVPKWIVNLFQKRWPFETLEAIKKQLDKPYAKEVPLPEKNAQI